VSRDNEIKIKLTGKRGKELYTLVDKEDFDKIKNYRWHFTVTGYAAYKNGKVFLLLHRLILNANRGQEIDHINRDKLDNRKCNLRFCTRTENCQNKTKYTGSSKYWGVYWNKASKSWRVRIKKSGILYEGGLLKDEMNAAKRYDELAIKYYGPNARLNFPQGGQNL
jgi:hypothetical protein